MQNAIGGTSMDGDVASQIAGRSLARRGEEYVDEVRRLLDAALSLMRQHGTTSSPRVADVVAAAGLSNDAFYRHFASKDALVAAILEDGSHRLVGYLSHQMDKEAAPHGKVRRWVEGVLSQAEPGIADATLAVLWNGGAAGSGAAAGRHFASTPLAALLEAPYAALGSASPELDATLASHAVLGVLSDCLWQQRQPTRSERKRITEVCLRLPTSG
ncbi:MAG TPA: TetR/AcrR family transcriptional regulator [Mycobacteriales bacterium]|nr:TetR/AcrR family transcriptional regulator [Mycobacteriales bacterium]